MKRRFFKINMVEYEFKTIFDESYLRERELLLDPYRFSVYPSVEEEDEGEDDEPAGNVGRLRNWVLYSDGNYPVSWIQDRSIHVFDSHVVHIYNILLEVQ